MRHICQLIALTLLLSLILCLPASGETVITSPFTKAISMVRSSVVGVRNYQTIRYSNGGYDDFFDFFGFGFGYGFDSRDRGQNGTTQEVLSATGSAVVVAPNYVLTNYHVVSDATSLKVTVAREGRNEPDLFPATVVASDSNLDVAVLYVPDLDLTPVALGDSDTLVVGDWAICIGNPLSESFSGTVTAGIVSALNRTYTSTSYDRYGRRATVANTMIQTDAAINSGNSGGGMFSVTGELMGIPTIKYTGSLYSGNVTEGIGLCIPINAAKPIIEEALTREVPEVTQDSEESTSASDGIRGDVLQGRARLGVRLTSLNTSSAAVRTGQIPNGAFVAVVESGSPAESAGMMAGDIIVDIDGTVITSVSKMQSIISEHKEHDVLAIKVYRIPGIMDLQDNSEIPEGEYIDLSVRLAIVDSVAQ